MDERAYQRAVARAFGKAQKKINKLRAKCFYPGCKLNAIDSHSQQKLGQLRAIAENGEVFGMQRNHYQTLKQLPDNHFLVRMGIAEASTFKGFCANHDQAVFEPIELRPLELGNEEQAFILFVRAFSYEFAQKRKMLEWKNIILNDLQNIAAKEVIEHIADTRDGIAAFFKQDAPYYMDCIFSAFENKNYSDFTTIWKTVGNNIGISSCCVYTPLLDQHDDYMEKTWGVPQPLVSFNLVPETSITHVVTSWLPNSNDFTNWINDEVETNEGLELYINRCAITESEDTCIRPSLWESLSEQEQKEAEIAMFPIHMRGSLDSIPKVVTL